MVFLNSLIKIKYLIIKKGTFKNFVNVCSPCSIAGCTMCAKLKIYIYYIIIKSFYK